MVIKGHTQISNMNKQRLGKHEQEYRGNVFVYTWVWLSPGGYSMKVAMQSQSLPKNIYKWINDASIQLMEMKSR